MRELVAGDFNKLLHYLGQLSDSTKSRFGPHAFDAAAVIAFYNQPGITGYAAIDNSNDTIIAYSIIKEGMLLHDRERLLRYGYTGVENSCCTYAPSVADAWQGKGVGRIVFSYILARCVEKGLHRIILWGGVQATNERALQFYKKLGFVTLGQFEYNGHNLDMLLEVK